MYQQPPQARVRKHEKIQPKQQGLMVHRSGCFRSTDRIPHRLSSRTISISISIVGWGKVRTQCSFIFCHTCTVDASLRNPGIKLCHARCSDHSDGFSENRKEDTDLRVIPELKLIICRRQESGREIMSLEIPSTVYT